MGKVISEETYKKLKQELEKLKKEGRRAIAEKIKIAREFGDLSENAEYQSALEEQKSLEKRIFELENLLKTAKVIKTNKKVKETSKVEIGTEVVLLDLKTRKKLHYKIVTFGEANPFENKISPESTLGKSLIGKKEGEVIEVELGEEVRRFKIQKILS